MNAALALAAAQDAARVIGRLIQAGMLSAEQRKAAEELAVAELMARDLPADLGAEWAKLHEDDGA